jgi:hypothetical protein
MSQPSLASLANQYGSDKGDSINCAHNYARLYERILAPCREAPLKIAEIGLMHVYTQAEFSGRLEQAGCASLRMWEDFLPNARISGFDLVDLTALSGERIHIVKGDQGNRNDLEAFARADGPFDVIIDDGSHASHHQQISLGVLFPHLAPGGLYIIEDLHFQPTELEMSGITKTKYFLRNLAKSAETHRLALTQTEYGYLLSNVDSIHFFDSLSPKWTLQQSEDAFAVISKRGNHAILPAQW